jgi:ABC-type polar amino acid transport system ATPase subunit
LENEILFFDEATFALYDQIQKEITDSIHLLNNGNLTMIIIPYRKLL